MKKILLSLVLLTSLPCMARVLQFVQSDFDVFVTQSVPQADQERFRGYFTKLQEQMQSGEKPETTRKYIYNRGFEALERDHAEWSKALASFMSRDYVDESYDSERTEARSFVYWHGAFEEFKQAKNQTRQPDQLAIKQEQDKTTTLTQAKSYVTKATQKVSNWFRGFRRS
jgi:hypothetical protein